MWPLRGREIREALGGRGGWAADDDVFTGVAALGGWAPGDVFFALDGDDRALLYLRDGGKLAIVATRAPSDQCVRVDDVLHAFKKLAAWMRARYTFPVIAVAGANGKTTTKDMMRAVLAGGGRRVTATAGTENGHYGVPLTLLDRAHTRETPPEALVLEIGIDEVGAMRGHVEIARPDFAVITSLGEEHLRGLMDEATASREELAVLSTGARRIEPAACEVGPFDGAGRELRFPGGRVHVPMPGEVHAGLAALAVATGLELGRTPREIEEGFATFRPPPGRAEIVPLARDVVLVDDSFNANPPSVRAAIDLLSVPAWRDRPKALVLGDMLDLGDATDAAHAALVPLLRALSGAHVRLYGDAMGAVHRALAGAALASLAHAPSSADSTTLLDAVWGSLEGAVVLVKGSRGMRLDRVADVLRRGYAHPRPLPPKPSFASDFFSIGVTGTNGKTSTTTWTAAMLARKYGLVARATTLGYFVGDERLDHPFDFDGFAAALGTAHGRGARACVLEVTSEALQHGFAKIWPFDVAVFTNLTHDHLDVHTTPEHYLASKAQLFMSLRAGGTAVLNACDPASELLREVIPHGARVLRYGVASRGDPTGAVDLFARTLAVSAKGTHIHVEGTWPLPAELLLPVIGDVFVENALAAALAAHAAGVGTDDILASLGLLTPPPGRFEVVAEEPLVVVDYAHTPDALARTLATGRSITRGRVILVFGAGGQRDTRKRGPMGQAAAAADVVYVTSDNPRDEDPRAIARDLVSGMGAHAAIRVELDRARAIERAIDEASPDDVVLVCGRGHETHQTLGATRVPLSDADVARAARAAK